MRQRLAPGERRGAGSMRGEVSIAETKPTRLSAAGSFLELVERVPGDAPASLLGCEVAQGVHDRVEVRAYLKPPVHEVVARVHDDLEGVGRQHAGKPIDQASAADSTRKRDHLAWTPRGHA